MALLTEEIHSQIARLCERGDQLAGDEAYEEALKCYKAAFVLIPAPKADHDATLWLFAAMGDAYHFLKDFQQSKSTFREAMLLEGAQENPFIRLRLGQALVELGEKEAALPHLQAAFWIGGVEFFEADDPKYLELLADE
jgi:tetratricopeptide (TPR) repeat protein